MSANWLKKVLIVAAMVGVAVWLALLIRLLAPAVLSLSGGGPGVVAGCCAFDRTWDRQSPRRVE